MSVTEIEFPTTITRLRIETIKKVSIKLSYLDGSTKESTIQEGDSVDIKYFFNGKLLEAVGRVTKIIETNPYPTFTIDASSNLESHIVNISSQVIKDVTNITDDTVNISTPPIDDSNDDDKPISDKDDNNPSDLSHENPTPDPDSTESSDTDQDDGEDLTDHE